MEFTVRRTTEEDWRQSRDLRLEMLADTPLAFTETLECARLRSDEQWRERTRSGNSPTGVRVAAIASDGRWIGTMGAYIPPIGTPVLVGVYVAAPFRGSVPGVTDALLEAVEEWARERGDTLTLLVHERNARALAAYAKRGFQLTGRSEPYELNPSERDLEMVKPLCPDAREEAGSAAVPDR